MQEISLYILDIAKNSVAAGADCISISLTEKDSILTVEIGDNGRGMSSDTILKLTDPFYTTRTTRKVGLGIPLFKLAADMTGGSLDVKSVEAPLEGHGTVLKALFYMNHLDCLPLGDMVSTVITLIQGSPDIDFVYSHVRGEKRVFLDCSEIRKALEDVPLSTPDVLKWIEEYLKEQYSEFNEGRMTK